MEKADDRRVLRTRKMLSDALIELMVEKGYDAITIQDIIDRANIGRSTYYLHFYDKEQLLLYNIDQLREYLKQINIIHSPFETQEAFQFNFSMNMLQHAQSHKTLYTAIVIKKGGTTVINHMRLMISDLIRDDITVLMPYSDLPLPKETMIDFVANTFLTLLTWWMDQNMPCSAEDVNRIFHKLTLSGLNSLHTK